MASATTYAALTVEDHIRAKDMWAGTKERIATPMIIFSRKSATGSLNATYRADVMLSPALFKCIDEPIVNALDQAQRCEATTEIRIDFDSISGQITVANNGDGIPIVRRKSTQGMYVPQFVFGVVFTGSNMTSDSSSTLGGTNGIGVKITNIHSREFHIETHDRERDRSFSQTWTNGMRECSQPIITSPRSGEGTSVTFQLDYSTFGTNPSEFESIVFTRAIWAAFYLAQLLPRTHIIWNGNILPFTPMQFAKVVFKSRMPATNRSQPIQTDIDYLQGAVIITSPNAKRYAMSVINGIMVPSGNHVDHVFNSIKDATKAMLAQRLRANSGDIPGIRTFAQRLAIIVLWCATDVHWTSQSKDCAKFAPGDLRRYLTPSDAFVGRIASTLSDAIIAKLDRGTVRGLSAAAGPKIEIDKYTPARLAGTRQSAKCRLFLAEGDSAKGQVEAGISCILNFDYFGVLSLRGVIPNVRKESVKETDGQSTRYKRSKKLIDNKFVQTLVQVLGLDFIKTYATPAERATLRYGGVIGCVDQDLDGIGNIFSLILNLFHLYWPALFDAGYVRRLATPIIRAYPKIRGAASSRTAAASASAPTPARSFTVKEFYSDEEYQEWVQSLAATDALSRYRIRYYKGLGTHDKDEMRQIMRNLTSQIITYQNDDDAEETFEIYLGRDSSLRRQQLSQPPPESDPDIERDLSSDRRLPASYHLLREAHAYQLDNLHRKINDVIGGTNQVSCKIINGSLKVFAQSNEEVKVVTLAGVISTSENYHHGEASLQNAITRRAFLAPGGNQLPLFLQHGQFGDREMGVKGAASARYIQVKFNNVINSILYSPEDYPLLRFHFDEGKRGEPHYFVPIIPMAIIENIDVPGHGWNICVHAREVMDVIANVRLLINMNGSVIPRPMRPCCYPVGKLDREPLASVPPWSDNCERIICDCRPRGAAAHYQWKGYIIERVAIPQPETWTIGTYEWIAPATIAITELPLGVWTKPYVKDLDEIASREGSLIKKYIYRPNAVSIDIQVTFDPESPEFAQKGIIIEPHDGDNPRSPAMLDDPIICALHLRERMADNINFMMPDESIYTFPSYVDVMAYWFPVRREYYVRRVARQKELISMRILYHENILRYIQIVREARTVTTNATMANIATMTIAEAEAELARMQFARLNIAALESPELKYEPNVAAKIQGPDASFAYILNLRERDITKDGAERYQTVLNNEREKLRALEMKASGGPFIGANIWLDELDALERAINWGRETDWHFGEYGRYKYS